MLPISVKKQFCFTRGQRTRKVIENGPPPEPTPVPEGRIPRISRLMALAIRFDRLIKEGEITDQSELARLGNVTRARVTQIMNLPALSLSKGCNSPRTSRRQSCSSPAPSRAATPSANTTSAPSR
jgi:hypothetical protein